jgi:hypothetical protein
MELKPQVRIGAGYDEDRYRVGVEVDLTKNDPIAFAQGSR